MSKKYISKFIKKIFYIRNVGYCKVFCIFGFKIKITTAKLLVRVMEQKYLDLKQSLNEIEKLKNQLQGILRIRRHWYD